MPDCLGSGARSVRASTTNAGTITRTYDDLDRLTNEKSVNASSAGVTYTYNPDGTRATMTVQNQTQVVYGWR
jgi:YD repeat-containing protein